MHTRHQNRSSTQHNVLFSFDMRSTRDLVACVLMFSSVRGLIIEWRRLTVSMYSVLTERRDDAVGRDMFSFASVLVFRLKSVTVEQYGIVLDVDVVNVYLQDI
jgi:hypothetical protein